MDKLKLVVKALADKHAEDIKVIDMQEHSSLYDYLVVCSANNERLINAIKENLTDKIYENGYDVKRVEGKKGSKWILVDLSDIIVHIFDPSEREHYNLEKLWSDLKSVDVESLLN